MRSLREAFLTALPPTLRERWENYAALETELDSAVRVASERWTRFSIEPEAFVTYLAARIQPEQAPDTTAFVHAAELYLSCAIAEGQSAAMREFDREYMAKVAGAVSRFRLSSDELDDLKQILRQQLLMGNPPKIVDYSGLGELSAWLRVAAVRAAIKMKKARLEGLTGDDELENLPGFEPNAELKYVAAEHRVAFRESFRQAIASLDAQEQNVLRQHHLDGLTLEQLASLYRVHRTTTAYWLERARDRLLKRTRQTLMQRTKMSASDCDSLFQQAQSQFPSTIKSLFR